MIDPPDTANFFIIYPLIIFKIYTFPYLVPNTQRSLFNLNVLNEQTNYLI